MLTPKKITKQYLLFALFATQIFFTCTPLSAMLTKQELANREKFEAQLRGDRINTITMDTSDVDEENKLYEAIRNNDPEAVEKAKAAGGNNKQFKRKSMLKRTALEQAACFGCFPSILRMLYNENDTTTNERLLFYLFDGPGNAEKGHFIDSALALLELGAPINGHSLKGTNLVDYSIKQYNQAATYATEAASHASWKVTTNNLGAFINMLIHVSSVDIKDILGRITPEHRNKFKRNHCDCEFFRDQSALQFFFIERSEENPTNPFRLLPPVLRTELASYLGSPWQELKKTRKRNQLKQQQKAQLLLLDYEPLKLERQERRLQRQQEIQRQHRAQEKQQALDWLTKKANQIQTLHNSRK